MFMNENVLKGSWKQVKGEMQRLWGDITNDEWDQAQGNATSLAGLVQKKYGLSQAEVETKFNDIFSRFSEKTSEKSSEARKEFKH